MQCRGKILKLDKRVGVMVWHDPLPEQEYASTSSFARLTGSFPQLQQFCLSLPWIGEKEGRLNHLIE